MIYAIDGGHYEIAELLLERGADPNLRNIDNLTPLIAASFYNRHRMVELLLKKKAEVDAQDYNKVSALMLACRHGQYETAKLLIEKGATVDLQDFRVILLYCELVLMVISMW